jgi:hypothetical protein
MKKEVKTKMKKGLLIALIVIFSMSFAGVAFATVVNSEHDLTGLGNSGTTQPCVFCHHPHRGDATVNGDNDLLWNLIVPDTSYVAYADTATTDGSTSPVTAAAPQSFLCMSCHNDTIAAGALFARLPADGTQSNTAITIAGVFDLVGTVELEDDHPVNFSYTDALTGGGLRALTGTTVQNSGNTYPLYGATNLMQCSTCHDVHAGDNSQSTAVQFMRGNIAASEICIDCHTNK